MWCDFTVLHVLYLTSCLMYLSFLVVSPSHSFPPICISICIITSKLCQTPPHIRTLLQLSILGQAVISCLTCLCQLSLSPPLLKDSARMFHYYLYPNLQRAVRYSFFLLQKNSLNDERRLLQCIVQDLDQAGSGLFCQVSIRLWLNQSLKDPLVISKV